MSGESAGGGMFCDAGVSFASLEAVSAGETADSGDFRHGWSHCIENRSLMTRGKEPEHSGQER